MGFTKIEEVYVLSVLVDITQPDGTTVTVVEQTPVAQEPVAPVEVPATPVETQTVTPQSNPQTVELPGKVNIPVDGKTTITVKQDSSHPDGVTVTVVSHKTHRDILLLQEVQTENYPPMFSPAIVQKVNEDGSCNLVVFANSDGMFFPKNVLELNESETRTGWMWPPRI